MKVPPTGSRLTLVPHTHTTPHIHGRTHARNRTHAVRRSVNLRELRTRFVTTSARKHRKSSEAVVPEGGGALAQLHAADSGQLVGRRANEVTVVNMSEEVSSEDEKE